MIDTLESIMARHRLIISPEVLFYEITSTDKYPSNERTFYQLLHQMSKVTYQKGCLVHDDRLDGLAGAVRMWIDRLNVNEQVKLDEDGRNSFLSMVNGLLPKKATGGNIKNRRACYSIRRRN